MVDAIGNKKTTSTAADYIKKFREMIGKDNRDGATAFTAYISPDDFNKRGGQVPGLEKVSTFLDPGVTG